MSLDIKFTAEEDALFDRAIAQWGIDHVLQHTMEECSELIQSCAKVLRGRIGIKDYDMTQEIIDVSIMIKHLLKAINDPTLMENDKHIKTERLKERLEKYPLPGFPSRQFPIKR